AAPPGNAFDQFDNSKGSDNAFDQFGGGQQTIAPVKRTWDAPADGEDNDNERGLTRQQALNQPRALTEDVPVDESKLAPWQTQTPPVADEIAPHTAENALEDRRWAHT